MDLETNLDSILALEGRINKHERIVTLQLTDGQTCAELFIENVNSHSRCLGTFSVGSPD